MEILIAILLIVSIGVGVYSIITREKTQPIETCTKKDLENITNNIRSEFEGGARNLANISGLINAQLTSFTQINEQKLENIRGSLQIGLQTVREDNVIELEKIRETVNEKLQGTLERRLGESFSLVSERLERVHQGLGEMQVLAAGVGDLKKVLSNIKSRGTWGEVQLGNLLQQILTVEQYECNVITKAGTNFRVEFAVKMPGRTEDNFVYLPIDAKFPISGYENLINAQDAGNSAGMAEATKDIERSIKTESKDIFEKYIDPPNTTDFAILFIPIEGLYAEVLRNTELCEFVQNNYRVLVAGPTTIMALLNCLQLGFRTLAIEKKTSEAWTLLESVKFEIGNFAEILDKVQKKIQEASSNIDLATKKTKVLDKKLCAVGSLSKIESCVEETK
jgi:DNA recombination protein RmuC